MDASSDILNLNCINLMGIQREPRRHCGDYVHKDQLEFYMFEGEDENLDCHQFCKCYRFRKETVKELAGILEPEIGPFCECHDAFTAEQ